MAFALHCPSRGLCPCPAPGKELGPVGSMQEWCKVRPEASSSWRAPTQVSHDMRASRVSLNSRVFHDMRLRHDLLSTLAKTANRETQPNPPPKTHLAITALAQVLNLILEKNIPVRALALCSAAQATTAKTRPALYAATAPVSAAIHALFAILYLILVLASRAKAKWPILNSLAHAACAALALRGAWIVTSSSQNARAHYATKRISRFQNRRPCMNVSTTGCPSPHVGDHKSE